MKLLTQIQLDKQPHNQIDYKANVLLLGSCFSENIGDKFEYFKFQSKVNPFGIQFHPLAIENLITRAITKDYYSETELVFNNEQWCCLEAHSKLNAVSKEVLLNTLNAQIEAAHHYLKKSSHIIITLGTAWVYRYIATNKIVANCHKLKQKEFIKELLSVEQITASLEAIVSLVRHVNPKVNFIFTVSPVRHLKDGFIENTQSKSHLVAAIHSLLSHRAKSRCHYFPSYEIVMDELRDYRFYAKDMVHPNELAIDYIWGKFKYVWLTEEALKIADKVAAIQAKIAHRPFNPNSVAHQQFCDKLQSEIKDIQNKYPNITF
ncbi:GSCFA domain-containing protein [uncultured Winogradskyella sp.]|uniref:GSCFA domain-containing protein n=1 Tax=uncultured Winogradskyella sp. TaxID=395353 RepID=UPI0026382FFB|nr:GSCFA domain-containing protein [uncultured Winogradskyella sp.]